MTHSYIFSALSLSAIGLLFFYPSLAGLSVLIALFFTLGLPHGALDIVLGRELLFDELGRKWWIPFTFAYLLLSLAMIAIWTLWPFLSFALFLIISVLHFGFSDATGKGVLRYIEGIARGLIPLTMPAYFYPNAFRAIIESTLTSDEAIEITSILSHLCTPNLILVLGLIIGFLYTRKLPIASELSTLLILFITLPPFTAFLIYFCFLHSIRHTLMVMKETQQPLRSVIKGSILPTLFSALWLIGLYYYLREKEIDLNTMYYLFFMGLAALTLPHMLLVEGLHTLKNSSHYTRRTNDREKSLGNQSITQ